MSPLTKKGKFMKKSERLNKELMFLNNKKSFNLIDLMNEFGISKRTALRDIQDLEELGLSLYVENGRYGGYKIINKDILIPVYFDNAEITSIFFALKALTLLSATPFKKSYEKIYEKLMSILSKEQKEYVLNVIESVNYTSFPPVNNSNYLSIILDSILQSQVLDIVYTQHGYEKKQILVYDLFYRNGIWFSNAFDINKEIWGIYRCDYIEKCTVNSKIIFDYTREKLKKSLENHEKSYHDIPFRCEITHFGKELFLRNNYPNMKLEEIEDKFYIKGGFNIEELHYMMHYMIEMGNNVIIEYPEILKESYLEQLKKIIDKYTNKKNKIFINNSNY